jgi:hypothetical protein
MIKLSLRSKMICFPEASFGHLRLAASHIHLRGFLFNMWNGQETYANSILHVSQNRFAVKCYLARASGSFGLFFSLPSLFLFARFIAGFPPEDFFHGP